MAPESERATCGKLMSAWNPRAGAAHCNRESGHDGSCSHTFTYQPEPTLTCSEVVESAPELCNDHYDCRDCAAYLAWRERRVQELEAFKRYVHDRLDTMGVPHSDPESEHDKAGCRIGGRLDIVEKALAKSEWREQIRKGAKHDR
jgi:hypothetical protein